MQKITKLTVTTTLLLSIYGCAKSNHHLSEAPVPDNVIASQRAQLAKNTLGQGYGPQAPRDIEIIIGNNKRLFSTAPAATEMNLCNIHFHKNAEHKGGQFTQYAGNGDGKGFQTGYQYTGKLAASEMKSLGYAVCPSKHSTLRVGDTIEAHYVYTTAKVTPGPTLGSCLKQSVTHNPQLRVEAQVYVLVNNESALDFGDLTRYEQINGLYQAINIPNNTGMPVQYAGSTTGPSYNQKASPFQASWSVRPKVAKVNIESIDKWCQNNVFNEDHAHGVRNLVINPDLLSTISS